MNVIILLSLVTAAYGARLTCEETCRIPSKDELRTANPFCKCLEKYVEWMNGHTLQERLDEKRTDTIYYESTEKVLPQNRQLGYYFQATGGSAVKPYFHNYQVPANIIPNWTYQSNLYQSSNNAHNLLTTKMKRNNVEHAAESSNYVPKYFDYINILHDLNNNALSNSNIYQNIVKDLSENVRDCLELYAIKYSRSKGNRFRADSYKIYDQLPPSVLEVEIKNKCVLIDTIFTENVDKIKSYSNKNFSYKTTEENSFLDKKVSLNNKITVLEKQSKIETSTILAQKSMPAIQSNSNITWKNKMDVGYTTETNDGYSYLHSNNSPLDTSSTSLLIETTAPPTFDITVPIPTSNIIQETYHIDGEESLTDNEYSTIAAVNNIVLNTSDTTEAITRIYQGRGKNNITIPDELINERNVKSSVILGRTGPISGIIRTQYLEGEYAIPKVITTELSNDTIVTEIQGSEVIPNEDFVDPIIKQNFNDTISTATTLSVDKWDKTNSTSYSMSRENSLQSEEKRKYNIKNITDDTFNISGKLYFKFGPDYVPASFVQKPDGQVNLALNMPSLCKSTEKGKSKLIEAICNCIKF